MCAQSLSHVQLFATLWTVACQAPLSMGLSRQEYWSGLPYLLPGDLPNPDRSGIEPRSLTLQTDSLPSEPPGKPMNTSVGSLSLLQQIFLTQEWNWGLLHCRQILYQLRYQGSPVQRKGAGNQVVWKVLSLCWRLLSSRLCNQDLITSRESTQMRRKCKKSIRTSKNEMWKA